LEGSQWNSKGAAGSGAPKSFDPFATLQLDKVSQQPETKKINILF
jgi:hypothetical protein